MQPRWCAHNQSLSHTHTHTSQPFEYVESPADMQDFMKDCLYVIHLRSLLRDEPKPLKYSRMKAITCIKGSCLPLHGLWPFSRRRFLLLPLELRKPPTTGRHYYHMTMKIYQQLLLYYPKYISSARPGAGSKIPSCICWILSSRDLSKRYNGKVVGFHLLSNIYHVSETEIQMESSGSKGSIGYSFLESEKPMKKQTVAFNTGNNFQPGVFQRFGVHLWRDLENVLKAI